MLTLVCHPNLICQVASDRDVFISNCRADYPIPEVTVIQQHWDAGRILPFKKTKQAIVFLRVIHPPLF